MDRLRGCQKPAVVALSLTLAMAILLGPAAPRAVAGGARGQSSTTRAQPTAVTARSSAGAGPAELGAFFDDLEAAEDPALEQVRAGDLSAGELALVIIFLIILFPVGIILLIVFLVDD